MMHSDMAMPRTILLLIPLLLAAGCGADFAGTDGPPLGSCFSDTDCPAGLRCQESVCVAEDGLPPENPTLEATFLPPASSKSLLWTLSPDAHRVTAIDPVTLAVRSFPVAAEPVSLAATPGADAVWVLSREGASLTGIEWDGGAPTLRRFRLGRRLSSLALSPDGKWAVLWNPEGSPLDSGLEGLALLVDVASLEAGEPIIHERMVGRRPTKVFFRMEGDAARDAVVLAKEEVVVFDLGDLEGKPTGDRLPLPDLLAEPTTRHAIATGDGSFLAIGSVATPEVLLLDVARRDAGALSLPGPPSDLRAAGDTAVAVLRSEGAAAWFDIQAAFLDPAAVRVEDVSLSWKGCGDEPCTAPAGQVRISPDGRHAFFYSNATAALAFARLEIDTGAWKTFSGLRKPIRSLAPGSADRAIVIHQVTPSQKADLYERRVDESEGYSVVDLRTGAVQLRITDRHPPMGVVFAEGGRFASVVLRHDAPPSYMVDAVDLETLVPGALTLPSRPTEAGPLPIAGKIWVGQEHPLGRISFIDLARRSVQTITGFDFNGRIE